MPTVRAAALLLAAIFISSFVTACTGSNEKTAQAELERARVAQLTRAADETAIRAASAAWSHAANAKDLDKAVSFYADDAVVLPNKAPVTRGKENIRKNWAPLLALPGPGRLENRLARSRALRRYRLRNRRLRFRHHR